MTEREGLPWFQQGSSDDGPSSAVNTRPPATAFDPSVPAAAADQRKKRRRNSTKLVMVPSESNDRREGAAGSCEAEA